jgi:hypothetical protein
MTSILPIATDRQCQSTISLLSIVLIGDPGEHVEPGAEAALFMDWRA